MNTNLISFIGNPAPTSFVLYPEVRNPGITLQHLLYEISSLTGIGEEYQALLNFSSMELFYHLCADLYKKKMLTKAPVHAIIQKKEEARKFIEDNCSKHFTIPHLALKSGINNLIVRIHITSSQRILKQPSQSLKRTNNNFIFGCTVGMRYCDLMKIKKQKSSILQPGYLFC